MAWRDKKNNFYQHKKIFFNIVEALLERGDLCLEHVPTQKTLCHIPPAEQLEMFKNTFPSKEKLESLNLGVRPIETWFVMLYEDHCKYGPYWRRFYEG